MHSLSEFLRLGKPLSLRVSLGISVFADLKKQRKAVLLSPPSPSPLARLGIFIFHGQNILSFCQAVCHNTFPLLLEEETSFIHIGLILQLIFE